jgi:hypothetical protein
MDGDHFSVIISHLRHKTLEPNCKFRWDLVKPERRGQFEAMLEFLGLRKSFSCGCNKVNSSQQHCSYCGNYFPEVWTVTSGHQLDGPGDLFARAVIATSATARTARAD